jgi:hypothetical protein
VPFIVKGGEKQAVPLGAIVPPHQEGHLAGEGRRKTTPEAPHGAAPPTSPGVRVTYYGGSIGLSVCRDIGCSVTAGLPGVGLAPNGSALGCSTTEVSPRSFVSKASAYCRLDEPSGQAAATFSRGERLTRVPMTARLSRLNSNPAADAGA